LASVFPPEIVVETKAWQRQRPSSPGQLGFTFMHSSNQPSFFFFFFFFFFNLINTDVKPAKFGYNPDMSYSLFKNI
jgi:hypothetical protein